MASEIGASMKGKVVLVTGANGGLGTSELWRSKTRTQD
jgi:FlaA1/EpsC-like NDP-sugar epimerase